MRVDITNNPEAVVRYRQMATLVAVVYPVGCVMVGAALWSIDRTIITDLFWALVHLHPSIWLPALVVVGLPLVAIYTLRSMADGQPKRGFEVRGSDEIS